ncbi:hypothetical protein M231_05097 [Tremella mesenterica]|uniref:Uncharacterized protein n=1 Tax=Tremella mesenterica TaxID=5217 RepID=A0A4Q1BIV1_TREME|nr:hypothetical protein M231_05097 [Tremella mesenterica]
MEVSKRTCLVTLSSSNNGLSRGAGAILGDSLTPSQQSAPQDSQVAGHLGQEMLPIADDKASVEIPITAHEDNGDEHMLVTLHTVPKGQHCPASGGGENMAQPASVTSITSDRPPISKLTTLSILDYKCVQDQLIVCTKPNLSQVTGVPRVPSTFLVEENLSSSPSSRLHVGPRHQVVWGDSFWDRDSGKESTQGRRDLPIANGKSHIIVLSGPGFDPEDWSETDASDWISNL